MLVSIDTKLIYHNPVLKKSITFQPLKQYYLISCEEDTQNRIVTEPQIGNDGESFVSARLEKRYLTITGELRGVGSIDDLRRQLIQTVSPGTFATLEYYDEARHVQRFIDVMPEKVPDPDFFEKSVRFTLDLVAVNPYWRDSEKTEIIAFLYSMMHFPLVIQPGYIFGYRMKTLESYFENVGDANAGFRAIFYARSGTVTNPSVINKNTGAIIGLGYDSNTFIMQKGDMLEIVSHTHLQELNYFPAGSASAVDGYPYMRDETDFFTLPPGDNHIGYNADENVNNLEVTVYYTPKYLGV